MHIRARGKQTFHGPAAFRSRATGFEDVGRRKIPARGLSPPGLRSEVRK